MHTSIHPSSFHQRSAGFSVASMHPLFIQKLVGFPLHPSILFSSKTSTVSVCILPLFHLRAGGFSTSSIHHPTLHLRARGFPLHSSILFFHLRAGGFSTSTIHPLFHPRAISGTQGQKALGRAVITGYENTCKLRIGQGQMATLIMGMWKIPKK